MYIHCKCLKLIGLYPDLNEFHLEIIKISCQPLFCSLVYEFHFQIFYHLLSAYNQCIALHCSPNNFVKLCTLCVLYCCHIEMHEDTLILNYNGLELILRKKENKLITFQIIILYHRNIVIYISHFLSNFVRVMTFFATLYKIMKDKMSCWHLKTDFVF